MPMTAAQMAEALARGLERSGVVKEVERIADALERTANANEEFLERAKRPRPLFADYDAGVTHAQKERAALVHLLREIADDLHTPLHIVRRINNVLEG